MDIIQAEMVVIGGGGAGMAAALEAAERGVKKIVVLEKRNRVGGTSAMASGPFGAESPAQKRQAIIARRDDLYKRVMSWHHLAVNPRIVRAYIDRSGDTIRWLESKGLYFNCVPHSPTDYPLTWHVSKGDGAEILSVLNRECRKLGVEVLEKTAAQKLLKGPDGRINGVLAEQEGRSIQVQAGSAVIATGGFGGNVEMLRRYCKNYRENMHLSGVANTGDGLRMAIEAGAATDGLGMLMAAGPVSPGLFSLGEEPNKIRVSMTFISGEPSTVWVNKKGRRFIDETAIFNYYEVINALLRQPDGECYILFDTGLVKQIQETGLTNLAEGYGYGRPQRSPLPPGLAHELESLAEKGNLKISDDWGEIADWIGVERQTLQATLDEYNAACDCGHDAVFAKDRYYLMPLRRTPYYAIRGRASILNTMGGIKINEKMEVLDNNDDPVPGLYAAGVDTGGWTSETYCAALPGTAFGYALNSGRIAGENISRYLKERC